MVILDTCAIIEMCKSEVTFAPITQKKIKAASYILSVSFAEMACKIEYGKLDIGISPKKLYEKISQIKTLSIIEIGVEEWLDAISLDWKTNKDPVDRLITAFAIKKRIPIVTSDKKIKQFYKNVIW